MTEIPEAVVEKVARSIGDAYEVSGQVGDLRSHRPADYCLKDLARAALQASPLMALVAVLREIAEHTDPDDPDSYRADDREGCFDTVFETAKTALAQFAPGEEG